MTWWVFAPSRRLSFETSVGWSQKTGFAFLQYFSKILAHCLSIIDVSIGLVNLITKKMHTFYRPYTLKCSTYFIIVDRSLSLYEVLRMYCSSKYLSLKWWWILKFWLHSCTVVGVLQLKTAVLFLLPWLLSCKYVTELSGVWFHDKWTKYAYLTVMLLLPLKCEQCHMRGESHEIVSG